MHLPAVARAVRPIVRPHSLYRPGRASSAKLHRRHQFRRVGRVGRSGGLDASPTNTAPATTKAGFESAQCGRLMRPETPPKTPSSVVQVSRIGSASSRHHNCTHHRSYLYQVPSFTYPNMSFGKRTRQLGGTCFPKLHDTLATMDLIEIDTQSHEQARSGLGLARGKSSRALLSANPDARKSSSLSPDLV